MTFTLPTIYPITDTRVSGLSHLEQVRRLVDGGATLIQIRDKTASSFDFFEAANEVMDFCRSRSVRVLINDRVDLAIAVGADGVHLGQDDLPPDEARKLLGSGAIIGFSTHSTHQAIEALDLPIDYIAIGPIFNTATKADHADVVGLDGLRSVRQVLGDFPLVAIGGIDRENAASVLEAGADSVALISDLLTAPDEIASRFVGLQTSIADKANNVGRS